MQALTSHWNGIKGQAEQVTCSRNLFTYIAITNKTQQKTHQANIIWASSAAGELSKK